MEKTVVKNKQVGYYERNRSSSSESWGFSLLRRECFSCILARREPAKQGSRKTFVMQRKQLCLGPGGGSGLRVFEERRRLWSED